MSNKILALLTTAALAMTHPAWAQSVGGTPYVAVHGHAEVDVVPDRFPVSISIHGEGMDVAGSQAKVEDLTRQVLASARELRIADADIDVGKLDIDPQYRYDQATQKQVFLGNRYSRGIALTFHSLADLRALIGKMPAGKNLDLSTLAWESSSANEIRRKLLVDAIEDAKKTADTLAAGIDRKVLSAQTISTSPMSLSVGSYINAIDVASVESTSILTAEQVRKLPVARNVTSVALLAPGTVRSDLVLEQGTARLESDVYIIYLLGER
jgi:uncharacterized protein YggE